MNDLLEQIISSSDEMRTKNERTSLETYVERKAGKMTIGPSSIPIVLPAIVFMSLVYFAANWAFTRGFPIFQKLMIHDGFVDFD
jgi:hypothetical protein